MTHDETIFHLALPSHDLDETVRFYVDGLGCRLARRHENRVNLDFFGGQVVFYLAPDETPKEIQMYPRHFGISVASKKHFDEILAKAKEQNLRFFKEPFVRFEGRPEEHWTFFLHDPSHHPVEFKYYRSEKMRY